MLGKKVNKTTTSNSWLIKQQQILILIGTIAYFCEEFCTEFISAFTWLHNCIKKCKSYLILGLLFFRSDSGIVYLDGVAPPKPPPAAVANDNSCGSAAVKGGCTTHQQLLQTIREQDEGGAESR